MDKMELASRVEAATGASKALDREVALAVGWVRQSPGEAGRRHPAWFHPDDCRDGRVVMDSLHGTDVWRDPIAYTASIDAAMTLIPEGYAFGVGLDFLVPGPAGWAWVTSGEDYQLVRAATPALALTAACLRARAASDPQP